MICCNVSLFLLLHVTLIFCHFTAVLEQVKSITKQCDDNKDESEHVESFLNSYVAKLKELEDSLKQAVDIVKNASDQNDVNAEHFKDVLVRRQNLAAGTYELCDKEC